jgi:hydroxyacyl-ACP dehydratase HTD2-like protein with hotdog domain
LDIDALKARLETGFGSATYEIEMGMVQRFVQAIDDPNPQWQAMAPPTFVLTIGLDKIQELLALTSSGTILHGSTEFEYYQPIRPGDVITAATEVTNIRERQGKMGKTTFVTIDTMYENQRQELIARCRQMIISY